MQSEELTFAIAPRLILSGVPVVWRDWSRGSEYSLPRDQKRLTGGGHVGLL